MKNKIHRSDERGSAEHGWLHSRFSFSFAEYYNPDRMGFGALRVINDDIIEPGEGFRKHPHQNMEIISIVNKGALEHKDSFGNHGIINEGEVQYMSAGEGIYHSEFNPSANERGEFFQIWIYPKIKGGTPLYDKRDFTSHHRNKWVMLVSESGEEGSIKIRQDAKIYTVRLEQRKVLEIEPSESTQGRLLFVVDGSVEIDGEVLRKRDEMQIVDDNVYHLKALEDAKVMLFVVPL